MSWNSGPYPQGNQGYYGGPPPAQPYPGAYPGAPPPSGGYPSAPPPGYPGAPYPGQPGFNPPPPQPPYGNPYDPTTQPGDSLQDDHEAFVKNFDFSDKTIRRGFIRKVYSILLVQLLFSMAVVAWFLYHLPTRRFFYQHGELVIIAWAIVFVIYFALICFGELRRKTPHNYIFLGIFTFGEAFLLGACASTYETEEVFVAVGITAAVCLGLTLFAFQTKYDFTMLGGALFVATLILLIFALVAVIVRTKVVVLIYASLGALVFSIYLVYDTQLMLGGKHKYALSPEEYVYAALNLYIDVVNLFMYILTLIGWSK